MSQRSEPYLFTYSLPKNHWHLGVFLSQHGVCLIKLGRVDEAEAALLEVYDILSTALRSDHGPTRATATMLAELYETWGKPDRAAEYRRLMRPSEDPAASAEP